MLAAVDEGIFHLELGEIAHGTRYRDAAGLGQRLNTGGEIDPVAEDVLILFVDDHLAEMNADPEHHALLGAQRLVEARHALLDIDRRADRGHGRGELRQHGIARRPDQPSVGGVDRRPPDLDLGRLQMAEGARLRAFHHPGEPGEVGVDDGGQAALHDLLSLPVSWRICVHRLSAP